KGVIPAGLEMMDNLAIQAAEDFAHTGYPVDAEAILLCELDGADEELAEQVEIVIDVLNEANANRVIIASSEEEKAQLWAGRKAAFPAVGRISPDYYCMDGTIPRKRIAEVLIEIKALSEQYGLRVANVFHAGDGNLHPLILFDAGVDGELEKAEHFGGDILELCVKMGGTITGEHGVGFEKLDQMCIQFNPDELAHFHNIKHAFDPYELLNPGKVIPTLHRCAEVGAMHIHNGNLPHADIPRF
ncbi:MAG TPA: FAD-binding oxidoreductase, partial [Leucothrix mucor]|nr:FAD-binding oxidoreductase [Leucothrix mucor]